jgi:chromosome segregation ATPase
MCYGLRPKVLFSYFLIIINEIQASMSLSPCLLMRHQVNISQAQLEKAQLKINHLEADLQLAQTEGIEQKQARAVLQERVQQNEQQFDNLRKDAQTRLAELEQAHQETVDHLQKQLETNEKNFKQEISELKNHAENQRHKFIVEIDQLRTAKEKSEKAHLQAATELKNQLQTNKALTEQLKLKETDVERNRCAVIASA